MTRRTLCGLLMLSPTVGRGVSGPSLTELAERSYLDLLDLAPSVSFTKDEFEQAKKQLTRQREAEKERLKKEEEELDRKLADFRRQLGALNKEASEDSPKMEEARTRIHCSIQALEKKRTEIRLQRQTGVPVAFENKLAKVDLVREWPGRKTAIDGMIASGKARQRRFGDVEDIGYRKISKDQEKDIKLGEDAVREMKALGLIPPELEDKKLTAYVQDMADRVAGNSDLTVPVKLTVLRSPEVNAFALPGGYLFVNTGLIEKAGTESELAGVVAHELAHVSARHGARLMRRVNIANLMLQAAQIVAVLATGGLASLGAYYAVQYGLVGLGLVLNLDLLGVSREFEDEADQLGTQYAWKAGYDPRGFITFFDKMATEKGYVRSASFFRTHPPFFERIITTVSEIAYLPKGRNGDLVVDTTAFAEFKSQLAGVLKKEGAAKRPLPSLRKEPQCEPLPE